MAVSRYLVSRIQYLVSSIPHPESILQYIPHKIMVLRERRQVVVATALDADEGDHTGIERLQFFAVADGYEPVAGAV